MSCPNCSVKPVRLYVVDIDNSGHYIGPMCRTCIMQAMIEMLQENQLPSAIYAIDPKMAEQCVPPIREARSTRLDQEVAWASTGSPDEGLF